MNTIALSGTARTPNGTKGAAQLRREQRVPCVLYGGAGTVHFSVEAAVLRKLVFTPEVKGAELDIDGRKVLALVQDKQFHPVTDEVLHVDFMEVNDSKPAKATLNLRLMGQPIGVRKGGKLKQSMRKLRVQAMPADLPSVLELDVTGVDVNHTLRVSDLKFDKITLLEKANDVVLAVRMAKKAQQQEEAAAPGAPGTAAPAADAKKK
ncbi:MAG: 50S ribosomal protein L25 [Flavobacteriales bacterium]|jgi:large subunit ribosomal protein L25|nr:50S ribosomal protein L25 [Flavobacteriales bacterium]